MSHYEPAKPFDGYDPDGEYPEMMDFCIQVESIQSKALGNWLNDKLGHPGMQVIDVGCGPGIYLLPFAEAGCEVFGIDACPTGGSVLEKEQFERVDLRFPYKPEHRFDLAICFEVAEHLERHWSERLVDTLSDCADIIVFSGATPGQGGTYHVNEQPHEFWLDMFKERHNYVVHPLQQEMREFLSQFEPQCATGEVSGWLVHNTFLLIKEGALNPLMECADCGYPNDAGATICVECFGETLVPLPTDRSESSTPIAQVGQTEDIGEGIQASSGGVQPLEPIVAVPKRVRRP